MGDITKILIVDDDLGMGETLFDILSEVGFKITVVNDGYKAVDMISNNDFDLVLMDIKMPGINGVEVLNKIKDIKPSMKVFMMTAYTTDDLVKKSLKNGAFGVISKPLNIDKLLHFIEEIDKPLSIMLVDDDPLFCESLKDNLENMKHKVVSKNNGKEAIKYTKKNDVDIAFIDIRMPILNGLEVFLQLKEVNPKITGIMITAWRNEVEKLLKIAFENDLYACIYKPLEQGKIETMIQKVIRKKLKINDNPII